MTLHFAPCILLLLPSLSAAAQSLYVEEGRLLEPVFEPGSTVGTAVALSAGRIAVGDADPTRNGQVFTYTTSNGLWQYDAAAVAQDGTNGDRFGQTLALEGDTLAVGAPTADLPSFTDAGAAYVFARSGTSWVQQQKFTSAVPKGQGLFGSKVVVSGNTLAIGAPQTDTFSLGQVDVYVRVGNTWAFQQQLVPTGLQVGARAGSAIALQGDRLIVGASAQTANNLNATGQVFVFERVGGLWSETAVLDSPLAIAAGRFGESLALEGGRIAIGAIGEPISNSVQGRVHLFQGGGASWALEQTLSGVGTSTQNCAFGTSVSLSGARLAVGAPGHNNAQANAAGTVKLFELTGSTWTETLDLFGTTASFNDQLGASVALVGDLVVGGAPNGDVPAIQTRGEAYVFRLDPPTPSSYCVGKVASPGCVPAIGWTGTPSASNTPFAITASAVVNKKVGLMFYGFLYNQSPFQGGTLCVQPPLARTTVQFSGGSATGNDCTGQYTFDFNALIQSGTQPNLESGRWVYAQYWFRDPLAPVPSGLTNGLRFLIQP